MSQGFISDNLTFKYKSEGYRQAVVNIIQETLPMNAS